MEDSYNIVIKKHLAKVQKIYIRALRKHGLKRDDSGWYPSGYMPAYERHYWDSYTHPFQQAWWDKDTNIDPIDDIIDSEFDSDG